MSVKIIHVRYLACITEGMRLGKVLSLCLTFMKPFPLAATSSFRGFTQLEYPALISLSAHSCDIWICHGSLVLWKVRKRHTFELHSFAVRPVATYYML